ncbi:cation:proton antiporter [candidate division TA06 bacterium]|uniref:Cation:proton antiporter n=1 Tax=candidate division TA06 bacterium TaxID=2250710 RepID=A0A660S9L1_UNCT6|nr:MAG: cation:proton antiporter [candidate division TA06 bacterium]
MISSIFFYSTAFVLFLIGLFGVLTRKNIIKILVSLSITETAVNLFLVTVGYIKNGKAPILTNTIGSIGMNNLKFVDPLPQALVLTAIVIGLGTTALSLVIAIKLYKNYGTLNITKMGGKR